MKKGTLQPLKGVQSAFCLTVVDCFISHSKGLSFLARECPPQVR